jgi:hypothetical protein
MRQIVIAVTDETPEAEIEAFVENVTRAGQVHSHNADGNVVGPGCISVSGVYVTR